MTQDSEEALFTLVRRERAQLVCVDEKLRDRQFQPETRHEGIFIIPQQVAEETEYGRVWLCQVEGSEEMLHVADWEAGAAE